VRKVQASGGKDATTVGEAEKKSKDIFSHTLSRQRGEKKKHSLMPRRAPRGMAGKNGRKLGPQNLKELLKKRGWSKGTVHFQREKKCRPGT